MSKELQRAKDLRDQLEHSEPMTYRLGDGVVDAPNGAASNGPLGPKGGGQ